MFCASVALRRTSSLAAIWRPTASRVCRRCGSADFCGFPRVGLEKFAASPITTIPANPSPADPTHSSTRKAKPQLRAVNDEPELPLD